MVTFGIPLIFILLLDSDGNCGLAEIIKYGIDWALGCVGMWASKWVIASIVLKGNKLVLEITK